jgi:hypothetical protein
VTIHAPKVDAAGDERRGRRDRALAAGSLTAGTLN